MQVRIRNHEALYSSCCGDMTPSELESFVDNIKECGIVDSEGNTFDDVDILVQYCDTGDNFFAEVVWSLNE